MQHVDAATATINPAMLTFARIRLIPERWDDHMEVQESLSIPTWERPEKFEFQHDGDTYAIEPGKTITVPWTVAQHGIKQSVIFRRQVDQHGKALLASDKHGGQYPMVEQVGDAFAPTSPAATTEKVVVWKCPFHNEEFETKAEFMRHLASSASQAKAENGQSDEAA